MSDSSQNWAIVPHRVKELYVKYAADAHAAYEADPGAPGWTVVTDEFGPLFIKRAESLWSRDALPTIGAAGRNIQRILGGPNPATAALLMGGLGAGLGYTGGWLANKLFPKWVDESAKKKFSIAGGLGLGGLAGLFHGYPNVKHYGIKGLFKPAPMQGGPAYPTGPSVPPNQRSWTGDPQAQAPSEALGYEPPYDPGPYEDWKREFGKMSSDRFGEMLQRAENKYMLKCAQPDWMGIGRAATRPIRNMAGSVLENYDVFNKDQWGRVIERDPFLSAANKVIATAAPAVAGYAKRSNWVSPVDVAKVAAGAGLGGAFGMAIGKIGGAFLGLTPEAQHGIQRGGMLAGAIKSLTGIV